MKLFIRPQAKREMAEAASWYETQGRGLGNDFIRAVDQVLAHVLRFPEASVVIAGDIRRAVMRKYPYALFYTTIGESLVVLGCIHQHRDPQSWPH